MRSWASTARVMAAAAIRVMRIHFMVCFGLWSAGLMSGWGIQPESSFRGLPAKEPEDRGRDGQIEQGAADESADDHDRDRMKNLLARFMCGQEQRNESDARAQRRHQHGYQSFQRAAGDHLAGET